MLLNKVFIAACTGASLCAALSVNIQGIVKNKTGAAISGAAVKLEATNISTVTGPDGSFTLAKNIGISPKNNLNSLAQSPISFQRGQLKISLSEKAPVTIQVRNIAGRRIFKREKIYDAGTHIVHSLSSATGIHLYQVTIGQDNRTFKSSPIGSFSGEIQSVSSSISKGSLSKQAKASAVFGDVISVMKEGWLNYRDSVRTPDTAGIAVTMIPNAGNVTDADGNVYQSVQIGNQVWTAENLKTTKYNDGTPIPQITDNTEWDNQKTGAYCYYNNKAANKDKFGAMYNWYAVQTGKLAPAGWHVPTYKELNTLKYYLMANGYSWDGTIETDTTTFMDKVGKSLAAKTDWIPSATAGRVGNNPSANNATGFSAPPGGWRKFAGAQKHFISKDSVAYLWSITPELPDNIKGFNCYLNYSSMRFLTGIHYKEYGMSVRLIRDN